MRSERASSTWPPSPYKGLGYYTEADEPLFAGRDLDIHRCAAVLTQWQMRLLLLHGSTGCGKSSFLRAGLIPHIEKAPSGIAFARDWRPGSPLLLIRSTAEPLAKLADALHSLASSTVTRATPDGERTLNLHQALPEQGVLEAVEFRRKYADQPQVLLEILEQLSRLLPETLVLIIDQGEEVLTVNSTEQGELWRNTFFEFLSNFVSAQFDVKLVLALRTEYVGRFAARVQRGLRGLGCAEYFLDDLQDKQIMDAVNRPTEPNRIGTLGAPYDQYKFTFEDGVVAKMIEQLRNAGSGGRLSALQIACKALYERVLDRPEPRVITDSDLKQIGGVGGAVEGFLDRTLFECGQASGLAPVLCGEEVTRWKLVLHGLASMQPNRTVTTDIRSEASLIRDLVGTRLDIDQTKARLLETQLLREVNVVEPATGGLIRCFGLGHDTLGLVLHDWKDRYDRQVKMTPVISPAQPFEVEELRPIADDIALCMSGIGYRAMLFNLGSLWRLNELGYLPRLARISAVSGGAIVAAFLGAQWSKLVFRNNVAINFSPVLVDPMRALASQTIDFRSLIRARLLSGFSGSYADELAREFKYSLFSDQTLQNLPDKPRIVLSATNLQSASLFLFSKSSLADHTLGKIRSPNLPLARAVAASAAVPPLLAPMILKFSDEAWGLSSSMPSDDIKSGSRREVYLADGSMYDHLGLEAAWRHHLTLLVSDPGTIADHSPKPVTGMLEQVVRIINVMDIQVRAMRQRQVQEAFLSGQKKGAYWSMSGTIESLQVGLEMPAPQIAELASTPMRFAALPTAIPERLINCGYAMCDAAVRNHFEPSSVPARFPYPIGV